MSETDIAVIGMAGRFPGAADIGAFWANLRAGVESIRVFSEEELLAAGVSAEVLADPNYVRARGFLDDVALFDASFFGMSPREAEILDVQHRLFLECAWQAVEQAGYDTAAVEFPVGVFAGVGLNSYLLNNIYGRVQGGEAVDLYQIMLGNDKDFLATRVAYKLNLQGPSMAVQAACSTSLVAVHLACQSLLSGECDMALAGGVTVTLPQETGYVYQEGMILSPDGHCRAFDAQAGGTVGGSGVGIVVLKRLEDAIEDGDFVWAVVKGSAVNNDGGHKIGYTAPSQAGQAAVIREALALAGVAPEEVGYVEAHGTGTVLGDPIEVAALAEVFGKRPDGRPWCALGSVKTNVGHLDTAAGVAGFIKAVLALHYGEIPPSLHFERGNPEIDWEGGAFFVNDRLRVWEGNERFAGVSSFGIGGTNVHVVLGGTPPAAAGGWRLAAGNDDSERPADNSQQLLVVSGRTGGAVGVGMENLGGWLEERGGSVDLGDVGFTLGVGRRPFGERGFVVAGGVGEAVEGLRGGGRVVTAGEWPPAVGFLFPGQGAQYVGMGRGLYEQFGVFREVIDVCEGVVGGGLRDLLFDTDTGEHGWGGEKEDRDRDRDRGLITEDVTQSKIQNLKSKIDETEYAQVVLFAVEVALARLLMSWGVRPSVMVGHSLGEFMAACVAGVFGLEDGVRLVVERGRLMQSMERGKMVAVMASEEVVRGVIGRLGDWGIGGDTDTGERGWGGEKRDRDRGRFANNRGRFANRGLTSEDENQSKIQNPKSEISIAVVNGVERVVISGKAAAVDAVVEKLEGLGISYRPLATSHAYHSEMMAPIVDEFVEVVRGMTLRAPEIAYVSNVTGRLITADEAMSPEYWGRHLRETVQFAAGTETLLAQDNLVTVEVGPGRGLTNLVKRHPAVKEGQAFVSAMRPEREDAADDGVLLEAVGRLWQEGVEIDWEAFYGERKRYRLPLPTYPFERQRYWIEPVMGGVPVRAQAGKGVDEWLYVPSWERGVWALGDVRNIEEPCVVFMDRLGVADQIVEALEAVGKRPIVVRMGKRFREVKRNLFALNPSMDDGYKQLLAALDERPKTIVHCWSITDGVSGLAEDVAGLQEVGFLSVLGLVQALGDGEQVSMNLVGNRMVEVTGEDVVDAGKGTVLGLARVIPQEYAGVGCRIFDVGDVGVFDVDRLLGDVARGAHLGAPVLAYRGRYGWVPRYVRVEGVANAAELRGDGVYLVTGGFGGVGFELAEYLARRGAHVGDGAEGAHLGAPVRVALVSRSGGRPEQVARLEGLGAEVMVVSADLGEAGQVREAVERVKERWGRIDGVVHAAGIAGGGLIQMKEAADVAREFAAPVYGTVHLAEALAGDALDFFVLCSSHTAMTGGVGQAAYSAANAFQDAFAQSRPDVISINWDRWQGVGMAVAIEEILAGMGQAAATVGLTAAQGQAAFGKVLGLGMPQVIVSTDDFGSLVAESQVYQLGVVARDEAQRSQYARPEWLGVFVPPETDTEKRVATIWQAVLGMDQIGVEDDFTALGGDSLIALRLVSQLKAQFEREIQVRAIYDQPTVRQLAGFIDTLTWLAAGQAADLETEFDEEMEEGEL